MPELPEIANRSRELNARLTGKQIRGIEVSQPKSLNLSVEDFTAALQGARIEEVGYHGKWIQARTDRGWLLINMGMGGELLVLDRSRLPEKRRVVIELDDASFICINFWWFGYVHYAPADGLGRHPMVGKLGPNALEVGPAELHQMLNGQRGSLKAFLLDQSKIAGIGNAYIHDILFLARLHPLRKIDSLCHEEVDRLAQAIQDGLCPSLEKGGGFYEVDIDGQKGGFTAAEIIVGYREGQPCPVCGTSIQKIKTGSTASFICPQCQV